MPQRQTGVTTATCPAIVGDTQTYGYCAEKYYGFRRFIFKKKSTANPFTTFALLDTQAVWDTFLATADVVLLTAKIAEATFASELAAVNTSASGVPTVGTAPNTKISGYFADLPQKFENDLFATLNDNAYDLDMLIIDEKGRIRYEMNLGNTAPLWIPLEIAQFSARNQTNVTESEKNNFSLEVLPEQWVNTKARAITTGWSIFTK
jgi:hypothetical protein